MSKWMICIAALLCQLRWMPPVEGPEIREYRVYHAKNYVSDWNLIGVVSPDRTTYVIDKRGWYTVCSVSIRGSESDGADSVYYKPHPRKCSSFWNFLHKPVRLYVSQR